MVVYLYTMSECILDTIAMYLNTIVIKFLYVCNNAFIQIFVPLGEFGYGLC